MSRNAFRYLKWNDKVIAVVAADLSVHFTEPRFNTIVSMYTHGETDWTADEFLQFLSERIMSPARRDIERLLFRCGLSEYDTFKIADVTHAINPRDELWLAKAADDRFSDATTSVFQNVFVHRVDAQGESVDTPEGANVKRFAVCDGAYGIAKKRISPLTTDVESEIAVYLLAREMGVPCCPARLFAPNWVFSEFVYDFTSEYLLHMRRLFDGPRGENELQNLVGVRPQYEIDFYRMIALDFTTRQDDRHLSNIAVKVTQNGESLYPLYDNGRSLFYEDAEQFVRDAATDPTTYATTFGYAGTYWDHLQDIANAGIAMRHLLNLDISRSTVVGLLKASGFTGYRLEGATEWVSNCLDLLRKR